ncbi:MAG: glycerophosphodiester phosphodiesterase [Streptosporangiales bacterium]|nr:glycerophosphodiester phosphodiesterase [Streptosporangiales bacterium]
MKPRTPVFEPRPAIIGHRGLGGGTRLGLLENTLDSFVAAAEHGLVWVELDVRRSSDDGLVVHHNPTTDDSAFVIEQTTKDLAADGMSLLDKVLDALPAEVAVNIDVKTELEDAVTPPRRRTGALLVPVLRRELRRRRLFVSSFDPALLLYLRDEVPAVPLGLLTWVDFPLRQAVPAAAHLGMQVVGLHVGSFGPNRVEPGPVHRPAEYAVGIAHEAGLEVAAWCPSAETCTNLVQAGVDAMIVNDVPGVLAALGHVAGDE